MLSNVRTNQKQNIQSLMKVGSKVFNLRQFFVYVACSFYHGSPSSGYKYFNFDQYSGWMCEEIFTSY